MSGYVIVAWLVVAVALQLGLGVALFRAWRGSRPQARADAAEREAIQRMLELSRR